MNDRDLDALPLPARVALAAGCVEHVYPFYRYGDFLFRVRHAPGVPGPGDDDIAKRAIDMAWSFAETGARDESLLDATLDGMSKLPPDVDGADLSQATLTFLDAVVQLLRAMRDPTPASASGAISRCRYALMSALEEILDDQDEVDRLADLEAHWQDEVLARVHASSSPLQRGRFDDLLAAAPPWQPHVSTYRAYQGT
jgi:hypothetical protein